MARLGSLSGRSGNTLIIIPSNFAASCRSPTNRFGIISLSAHVSANAVKPRRENLQYTGGASYDGTTLPPGAVGFPPMSAIAQSLVSGLILGHPCGIDF